MSTVDPLLIGWWKVQSIVMPNKTLGLVAGSVGERVCFSELGRYRVYPAKAAEYCRCSVARPYSELDIWIQGLEPLASLCLYTINDDVLKITVAGRPLGGNPDLIKRPSAMRMDEKRNWAFITMKRCEPPKRRTSPASKRSGVNLKPGRLIPRGFLDK
jgi:hypothetical protein